jgi:opacity protein-like surface antigen
MKKSNIILSTGLLVLNMILPQAYAQDWYVTGSIGSSDPSSRVFNDGTNGAGNPRSSIESDAIYGIAVGYEIYSAFKIELEYSLASYDTDANLVFGNDIRALDQFSTTADIDIDSLMLNVSYGFENSSVVTPYLKAGVGTTFFDIDGDLFVGSFGGDDFGGFLPATFSYEGDGNEFAYFIGAGLSVDIAKQLELTLEYRYSDLGEVATDFDANGDRLQTDFEANNVLLGLRYAF